MLHLVGIVCTFWLFNFPHVSLSCEFLVWIETGPIYWQTFPWRIFLLFFLLHCSLIRIFSYSYEFAIQAWLIDFLEQKKILLNYFLWGRVHSQEIFNPVVPVPTVSGFLYYLICITFSSRFSAVVYPKHISTNLLCWLNLRYFSVSCEKTVIWLSWFHS